MGKPGPIEGIGVGRMAGSVSSGKGCMVVLILLLAPVFMSAIGAYVWIAS